nr:4Fe-4S dicluster domain-containing protein [uncultured Glaciecola sp.]
MLNDIYLLKDLSILNAHLAQHYSVVRLAKDTDGEVTWTEQAGATSAPLFGHANLPLTSPKAFFFPEQESLYKFDGKTFETIHPKVKPIVLFGVQACDLTAIAYQDQFFKHDPYYQTRRDSVLLVGIDCEAPCKNGFCAEVNAGPHVNSATADLILSRLKIDDRTNTSEWLIVASSEKGVDSLRDLTLEKADEGHFKLRTKLGDQVRSQFADFSYISNAIEYLNDKSIPAQLWEELSVRCLSCSGCTNLCPTCSCYSTFEVIEAEPISNTLEFETVRCWDSCLFESFQREASDHNPSHKAAQRVERFWFHKFSDEYLPEFERHGCVGCGRCEQTCPGTIGVHSVMKRIDEVCCN